MIGKSLLHYRVTEKIGAGGMGVVYRATDTKLHRDVAIKVLPEAFSKDKERLTRFEREARVLASLNHPNLAAIYGLEQSGGVHFLVLELIPGVTLAERIAAGAIGLEEALSLFSQIADAVEAAHSKGVIHRDLKPANIKITPEGKIIVLDFGLAKPFETEPMQDLSQSPTLTRNETATGVILGTASYMSPEQARRKGVDKRTDTWAFGCVLFEALSGRVAFPGETLSDTLANVLAREPLWEKLPETTPVSIRRLLRRCLQKDPERRLRDMGDARLDIEDARDGAAEDVSAPTPKPVARWRTTIPWLVTGLVVALWVFAPKATPPVIRSSLVLPPTQQLHGVAISPDGSRIVYAAGDRDSQELFLRHLSEEASAPIPGTENAVGPFFSPDGQWVGFFADNELRKVRLDGVGAVVLAEATSATSIKTGSWGLDGTIVFLQESGFMKISDGGGTPESLTTIDSDNGEVAHASARVLPGGEALLFAVTGDGINANIVVQSLETGERRFLVEGFAPRYVPTGHLAYADRSGILYAAPFDPERMELLGNGVPVQTGIADFVYDISEAGTLIYRPSVPTGRRLVLVDLEGRVEPLAAPLLPYQWPRFSPDGLRIAVTERMGGDKIHLYELEAERLSVLIAPFEGPNGKFWTPGYLPVTWRPDGTAVAIDGRSAGSGLNGEIFIVPLDGTGSIEHLVSSPELQVPQSWSPDGKRLLYIERATEDSNIHIWELPLEPKGDPRALVRIPGSHQWGPQLSPDERWLAYSSSQSGIMEVYVKPYGRPGGGRQVSTDGGDFALWSPDGRTIYYRNEEKMMAVDLQTEPGLSAGRPRLLFEAPELSREYDLSPDGRKFVMIRDEEASTQPQYRIVQNWFEELKRLVPTNQ